MADASRQNAVAALRRLLADAEYAASTLDLQLTARLAGAARLAIEAERAEPLAASAPERRHLAAGSASPASLASTHGGSHDRRHD